MGVRLGGSSAHQCARVPRSLRHVFKRRLPRLPPPPPGKIAAMGARLVSLLARATFFSCTVQRLGAAHRSFAGAPRRLAAPRFFATAIAASESPHVPGHMAGPELRETIFAVSSGAGVRAGVAVIRVSGSGARLALERMTVRGRADPSLAWLKPRMATLTKILAPSSDERLDSALVLWFPAPRSFTGEDVVELHVHGGRAVVAAVLASLGTLPGHRLAERGEFTRRAFANGQMDLTEVEGLSDLLAANTDAQRRQALAQMGGAARTRFESWRAQILDCLAHTEAVIDFGEDADDLGADVLAAVTPRVNELARQMGDALADARRGELLRDGPRVVIVGAPNAGKVRAAACAPSSAPMRACPCQRWQLKCALHFPCPTLLSCSRAC